MIDNETNDHETLEFLAELRKRDGVRVERIEGGFNYSRLNNRGVELSRGSLIALLNNDVEVINDDWLSEMVSRAMQSDVAMVGARLWYPNGTIQHGGVILGAGGIAGHAHVGLRRDEPGYFARAHLAQDVSAVTTACALVKRELYLQVGGFDENLAVTFNDVDFCLRLREAGYRIVWTPYAELIHHESASRGFDNSAAETSPISGGSRLHEIEVGRHIAARSVLQSEPLARRKSLHSGFPATDDQTVAEYHRLN